MTNVFDSGDTMVDDALTEMAQTDEGAALEAEAAFGSMTWGNGLHTVSLRGLQEFLWYQLPTKWAVPTAELHDIAHALSTLFERLELSTYAALCTSELTRSVIDAYDGDARSKGITAYRKALDGGGVEPPTIPGLLTWGGMMGLDEHSAFWSLADRLEIAVTAGVYTPGRRGWRPAMIAVATEYLTAGRDELGGRSLLENIHIERRARWAESRGPGRAALTAAVLPMITELVTLPDDVAQRLAPIRWLLAHADGDGTPLTVNHTLGRALLTEGCHRFNWLVLGKQAPPENQLPEAIRLRSIVNQLGATRRRGRTLLLTATGQRLLAADTPTLWTEVVATLIPSDPAEAAAAEAMLMLLLTDDAVRYGSPAIANVLTGEGWRSSSGEPLTADNTSWLTGELSGRLRVLGLTEQAGLTHGSALSPTGRSAAIAALRHLAHGPRDRP